MSEDVDLPEFPEGQISSIPLDRLMLSSLNVRQTERAADVDSLAEDIAARGLKQNLVVVPAHFVSGEASRAQMAGEPAASEGENIWKDRFEVIAGGRRFQAMQLLVEQERLASDFAVPCMVEPRNEAAETSLSENLHRVAMNPADEFEAFRVIVDQAKRNAAGEDPVAYCAKRFGVTVKHVNGRLRLASLAPEILDALRANEIGVDSAKAYAGVEDHALQLKVFAAQKKSNWQPHNPASVRGALRDVTLSINDGLVKFVGLDAYREAGGKIENDLFMGTEGEERVVDVKLIEKLGREKAEPLVEPQAKKDGFKSGLLATGVGYSAKWPKAPTGMERFVKYYQTKDPTKAELKKCVAVYAIGANGKGIEKIGYFRVPPPAEPKDDRDWETRQAENLRNSKIERRAAQMAVYEFGKFNGTPFEGRAFWPSFSSRPVALDGDDDQHAMVAVLIRVPVSSIETHKAEAERLIDEEAAAAAAAAAAAKAEEQAEDEGTDA